jgi:hypothetical protein
LLTLPGVALQAALISLTDQRNSVTETLLWNFSKVNLPQGGQAKSGELRELSATPFDPTKILRIEGAFNRWPP